MLKNIAMVPAMTEEKGELIRFQELETIMPPDVYEASKDNSMVQDGRKRKASTTNRKIRNDFMVLSLLLTPSKLQPLLIPSSITTNKASMNRK